MSNGVKRVKVTDRLYLDKRQNSPFWQGSLTMPDGSRTRFSTKTADVEAAKDYAKIFRHQLEERLRNNLPANTRKFSAVATATKDEMIRLNQQGLGRKVFADYADVIDKYLIPYFGNMNVASINQATLQNFEAWRIQQMGRKPKHSTLNTHNSAFNRVMDYAERHGWITRAIRPLPVNNGAKSESRGSFTNDEYAAITLNLRHWPNKLKKKNPNATFAREVLRNYILVLANTGIRHGTEALGLRWKNVSWHTPKDEEPYLRLDVDGKTGKRSLIARDRTKEYLDRQRLLYEHLQGGDFNEFLKLKKEDYVFADRHGKPVKVSAINQNFNEFLSAMKLKVGADGKDRTPYSLRHYYITQALMKGISHHKIATQVGTSTAMIDDFYSKISPMLNANEHSGRVFYDASNDAGKSSENSTPQADNSRQPSTTQKIEPAVAAIESKTSAITIAQKAFDLLISDKISEEALLKLLAVGTPSFQASTELSLLAMDAVGRGKLSEAGLLQIIL
jgi:integrase